MKDSSIKLNQQSKTDILSALDGQPPKLPCIEVSTPDQIQRLRVVREHFQSIKAAIEASVSEQENPITDPLEKKFVDRELKNYLLIYELLWSGWDAIKSEFLAKLPQVECFTSPGEAFAFVVELDCDAMLASSMQGGSVSAYESYLLLGGIPDSAQAKDGKGRKRVAHTLDYAQSARDLSTGSAEFLAFCEKAIAKRLRGNSTLKATLEDYRLVRSKRFQELRSILKTQAVKGEKWVNGQQLPL